MFCILDNKKIVNKCTNTQDLTLDENRQWDLIKTAKVILVLSQVDCGARIVPSVAATGREKIISFSFHDGGECTSIAQIKRK